MRILVTLFCFLSYLIIFETAPVAKILGVSRATVRDAINRALMKLRGIYAVKFSEHALQRLKRRKIPIELVEEVFKSPDEVVMGKHGRKIHQKLVGDKLIRVVVENDVIITVYSTSKISKYLHGGDRK